MRRAKIVATLGPAVDSLDRITELVAAGMDVARINRSHGSHEEHARQVGWVREAERRSGRAIGVLVDLQGPKIRTGRFSAGPAQLLPGAEFTITTRDVPGNRAIVSTTYPGLCGDVRPGDRLLIDDGKITLRALDVTDTEVRCAVIDGGTVSNNKGINLPGVAVSVPALSAKDELDLRWALGVGADWVALSFVRDAADITRAHEIMDAEGLRLPVLAKIEKPQAVDNLAEIIAAFDGIRVARGDLGVEMPLEEVPLVQKRAIEMARREAQPVIVAPQVLESMIDNPRPTRAEASDCANAVLDGADAIMLSGETSVGAHPVLAVQTMARIIENTEDHGLARMMPLGSTPKTVSGTVTAAAAQIGALLGAKYLVTLTMSGDAARRMARVRPPLPTLAFTPLPQTRRRLTLTWGISAALLPSLGHTSEMIALVDERLVADGRCQDGDLIVVVAGRPHGVAGTTNSLRVHLVGKAG
jgi:pyruvate kinase